jgi:repressor LexA
MESRGKNKKELAEIVGVSAPTMNDWLKAKKYPRIDKIDMLADYFGILKSDLIEEQKNSPPAQSITEGEQELLTLFRCVPENQQQLVLEMIRVALNTKL